MAPPALILHHYDFSNYSEKVRLVLGLKDCAWQSVTIPAWAPKPDYTPLTAGYRRTPALQIGADVYCDTRLIVDVLESLEPAPLLYPGPMPARTRALAEALVHWAETSLFRPLALYITGRHAQRFPAAFHADRASLHGKPSPTLAQVQASASKYLPQVLPQLAMVEDLFAPGQPYVLGDAMSLADFALYGAPWFMVTIGGESALPPGLPRLQAWMSRIAALGHGRPRALSAAAALDIARDAEPNPIAAEHATIPEGIAPGAMVVVEPLDQNSPATGRLLAATKTRITLATADERCGAVHVHFPRLGYRLRRARPA
ncbi:MAG: glutathione S-transferase family protein [Gammaproteobacteria bacterium]